MSEETQQGGALPEGEVTVREVVKITARKRFRLKDLFHRHPRG